MTITVRFTPKEKGPVAEAAIEFHEDCGPLAGFEINSIAIWRKREGSGYNVTFPARTWKDKTGKTQYSNYVRLRQDPGIPDSQKWALGNFIIQKYEEHIGEGRPF